MRTALALTVHLPGLVFGWAWALLFLGWAAQRYRIETVDDEPLILCASWRPWVLRRWRFSTTVGRAMVFQPHHRGDRRLRHHEAVHVRQGVDRSTLAALVALSDGFVHGLTWLPFAFWISGFAWQLPNFLTAALRWGIGSAYRQSEHERSAYDQTDDEGGA